jgi:hypothetical protein
VIDLQIDFDGTLLWNKTAVDRATQIPIAWSMRLG